MYQIAKVQDWIITNIDGQPSRGFLITVHDSETLDTFSLESNTTNPEVVKQKIEAHLANRRGLGGLTF